ncbi:MAG TPA: GntR family transcriptional regulator [Chloroflexota bacterium]
MVRDRLVQPSASDLVPRKVSRSNRIPLYHQVETDMRSRIERGGWTAGQQIPTEAQLCEQYGASRITIRQAITNLVREGLLVREPGRGTFVRQPAVTAGARGLTSFTQEMLGLGLRASARILDIQVESPSVEIADKLRLQAGEQVIAIRRLRLGNETPIGIQTAYLPAGRFPGLEDVELETRSLYEVLGEQYGVIPTEADETFWVAPTGKENAELLQVKPGACCFRVERITHDDTGPFEVVTSIMRGDRYRIHLGLRARH